jgi:hypothetical protein
MKSRNEQADRIEAEFRPEIKSSVPKIIDIFSNYWQSSRAAAVNAMKGFAGLGE